MRLPAVLAFSTLLLTASSLESIPSDTPLSSIVQKANSHLAAGDAASALEYFNIAITRDPSDYLTIFKRGATYLSLGKGQQAGADFNKVLAIRPDFEGALLQRAKLRARSAAWDDAIRDYEAAGRKASEAAEVRELMEARAAAKQAAKAEANGNWEKCILEASHAITVASGSAELRRIRARCRSEMGELMEAVADLQHLLHISTGDTAPHLQASATMFYALGDTEKGLAQVRKCLQSDPDSKSCRGLMKREKAIFKTIERMNGFMAKRQYNSAVQMLITIGDNPGLLKEVKEDMRHFQNEGYIHAKAPATLYASLVETACEAYFEMNNMKRAEAFCKEAQELNPGHTYASLVQAQQQLDNDEFEAALRTLNDVKDRHPDRRKVQEMMEKAQMLLKRSKTKDYYKVLGVERDADERDIKRSYRRLSKQFHPDKAMSQGISKEEAEKKMASINEAYEVLSDPELKARFDRGDDPNDQESQMRNPFQGSPFGFGGGGQQFVFRQGPGGGSFPFGGAGGFQFQGGGFPFG
jgi:DnaJ family protein C protein 3